MKRRYELVRCWAAANGSSTLVPVPTGDRYWFRRSAKGAASRRSLAMRNGMWFEVRRIE